MSRDGSTPRWAARLVVVLGALVAAALGGAGQASAHAVLIGTTPGGFEVLATAPREVTLRFNEPVELAEVTVLGPGGAAVAGLSAPAHPPGQPDVVAVTLPAGLTEGTYTVSYRVVSADAHPVPGAFAFSVGSVTGGVAANAGEQTADGVVSALYAVARWLGYAGVALLLGTAFFVAACWPGGEAMPAVRRMLWTGWGTLLGATVLAFVSYGPYSAAGTAADLLDPKVLGATVGSRMGLLLVVRVALLGLIAAVLVHVFRRTSFAEYQARDHRRRAALVLTAGAALAITWSLTNHSVTGTQVALSLPVDAIHLVAMAVWLGGLPVLLGVLLRSGDVFGMRIAIPRFSRTALVCVAVLVVTGTYQAWREVGSLAALFATSYGAVLLAKLGLVVVLVLLGALARQWVRRHYTHAPVVSKKRKAYRGPAEREVSRFRRMVATEAVLAAVVLGVTAFLVSAEPATAELARERAEAEVPARTGPVNVVLPFDAGGGPAGAGQLAALVTPGAVGRNEVHLAVLDAQRRPKQVAELTASLSLPSKSVGPLPVALQFIGGDHAIAVNVPVSMPGMWELAVTVRTSEVDQAVVRIPVGAR
ncbi:copper resistance CopC/CopD family protein [Amycolatopsis tucumanensis]|uniref:Copper resistance protein CopC n=1 Tax=Amycolatopsis tucumanensis TaxID=401106 RepID=A0ABP7I537_9PSEU|nr:CopD family protein [Amycolatopsis tucumanensis]